jgi:Predicted hydrolase (metallo-beta-lactamase superfamily)
MSIIKSFSVGDGDSFYIKHGSDNFTIIDCNYDDSNKVAIVDELIRESTGKNITRFISTHPDDDHICGLDYLDSRISILNFYCVKNEATKADDTVDFDKYCELRDSSKKAFYIHKGCTRKWMNQNNDERGSSGINILWPDTDNEEFKEALQQAKDGDSPNNISPIIKYSLNDGATVVWMGDLMNEFLDKIKDGLELPKANIVFAPHHGRKSGRIPTELLDMLKPDIIIIGEAPSEDLNYYQGYNTITQNSAGSIILDCDTDNKVHIYVSTKSYSVNFLDNEKMSRFNYYLGTLNL